MTTIQNRPEYAESELFEQVEPQHYVNVGRQERKASTIIGTALTVIGLSRRSLGGLMLAAAGGVVAWRGISGHCPLNSAMGRDSARDDAAEPEEYFRHGIHVEHAVTINKSPEELFGFWRDFKNLPHFMKFVAAVDVIDEKRSRWVAKAPADYHVSWEAEIINEEPNTLIAWRSLGGTQVDNSGSVRFIPAPGNRGTEVRVVVDYIPPAGRFGDAVAKLFGRSPDQEIREDLRRFKNLMEAGEIPTIKGQPRGYCD